LQKRSEKIGKIVKFGLYLIPAYISLVLLFHFIGPWYSRAFIPLFAYEIKLIRPSYDLRELAFKDRKRISYTVVFPVERPYEEGKTLLADAEIKGSALTSFLYIHPIIVFSVLFAWPGFSMREKLRAVMIALPLLALVTLIDIPFHLLYLMEMEYHGLSVYDRIIRLWGKMLNNGGRQFLSILVVFACAAPHYLIKPAVTEKRVGRNDPCPCGSGKKYKKCCMTK